MGTRKLEVEGAGAATATAVGTALETVAGRTWTAVAAVQSLNKVLADLSLLNLSPENINFSEDVELITRFGDGDATLQEIADRVLVLHELATDMDTVTEIAERDIRDAVVLNYFSLVLNEAKQLHGILEISRIV